MWRKWRQVLTPLNIISTLPLLFATLCGGICHTATIFFFVKTGTWSDGLLIRLEDAETGQRAYAALDQAGNTEPVLTSAFGTMFFQAASREQHWSIQYRLRKTKRAFCRAAGRPASHQWSSHTGCFNRSKANEHLLHCRRSGRGHRGRGLSWTASLKNFFAHGLLPARASASKR
jgi:hypothetical protein